MLRKLIALTFFILFYLVLFPTPSFAWDNLAGGDHGGTDWTVATGTEIAGVHSNIRDFTINSGDVVYVAPYSSGYGSVEIQAQNIYISGSLDGIGRGGGKTLTSNPGSSAWGGGGGGYGGVGGGGFGGSNCNAAGGVSYGTVDAFDIDQGADGGKGNSGGLAGGKGGAKIVLAGSETIAVTGSVLANGTMSGNGYGGGGSGGGVYLQAPQIIQSGVVEAKGGDSDGNGGGGAGGRVKYFYDSMSETGTESVAGGEKWPGEWTCQGEDGTVTKVPDYTPPSISHRFSGTIGNHDWYTSTVNVSLDGEDLESGIKSIEYWIDSGIHQIIPYSTGSNLVKNYSFEETNILGGIADWETRILGTATLSQSSEAPKFGSYTAKIESSSADWASFDTTPLQAPYLTAGTTYTVSGWVKRSGLTGNGATIRVLLNGNPSTVAETEYLTTDGDWERVSSSFSPVVSGIYIIEAGLDGSGTVWWDGVNLYPGTDEPTFDFVVSGDGSHQIHYFATNNQNLISAVVDSEEFKIDTVSPANWRNFNLVRPPGANSHTLIASIEVDDTTSGLNPVIVYFQYIVKNQTQFGYYTNLENCASTWVPNDPTKPPNVDGIYDPISGWWPVTVTPNLAGTKTATLTTPRVDYCDDNWVDIKKIKFLIRDMAGNSSVREFAVNTAWIQTLGGDVHAEGDIEMNAAASDNAAFLVSANSINNFVSTKNWLAMPYSGIELTNYTFWYNKIKPDTPLPGGKLPQSDGSGTYLVTSGYTIDGNTKPSMTASFTGVVFVNGDLVINSDFSLTASSALVFVVKGGVTINKSVKEIAGVYLTDGKIDTSSGGTADQQIVIRGSLVSTASNATFDFGRSLKINSVAAEAILFQPRYLLDSYLAEKFSLSNFTWQEVVP